jgi:hypothetical protein
VSAGQTTFGPGDVAVLTGSFTDFGTEGHTVTIDWGDGAADNPDQTTLTLDPGQTTFQTQVPSYCFGGTYTVKVTVTDDYGTSISTTLALTYNFSQSFDLDVIGRFKTSHRKALQNQPVGFMFGNVTVV